MKYAATAATYRGDSSQKRDGSFGQATLMWGCRTALRCTAERSFHPIITRWRWEQGANSANWGGFPSSLTQAYSTLADESEHCGAIAALFLYAKSLK